MHNRINFLEFPCLLAIHVVYCVEKFRVYYCRKDEITALFVD